MKFLRQFFKSTDKQGELLPAAVLPDLRIGMWCVDRETGELCIAVNIADSGRVVVDYADKLEGTYLRTTARPIMKLRQATHAEIPAARRPEQPATHLGY